MRRESNALLSRLLVLLFVCIACIPIARAQYAGPVYPPALDSIDLSAVNSETIFTGAIEDFQAGKQPWEDREVTLSVAQVLKGVPGRRRKLVLKLREEDLAQWKKEA